MMLELVRRGLNMDISQVVRWCRPSQEEGLIYVVSKRLGGEVVPAHMIVGKDSKYKFLWIGNEKGTAGVGLLLAEKWVDSVVEINRVSDRICTININVGASILTVLSVYMYAPQSGLDERTKDAFYILLQCTVAKLFVCGDFNGHIGRESSVYDGVHGGFGYGERNIEVERILEFSIANDFVICNSFFQKRNGHQVTYQSSGTSTQVGFILTRKHHFKLACNVKVIILSNEECTSQHKLLVCDLALIFREKRKPSFTLKLRVWKLRDPAVKREFLTVVRS